MKNLNSTKKVSAKASTKVAAKGSKTTVAKTPVKKSEISLMDQCFGIFQSVFADKSIAKPRAAAIELFQSNLGMAKTAAATYFGHCLARVRNAEQEAALAKIEKGGKVWSAVKVNADDVVTSVGLFISAGSAKAFNEEYRHDGTVVGAVEVGTVLAGTYEKRKKLAAKLAKAA